MHTLNFRDRPSITSQTKPDGRSLCPHWFPTNGTCQSVDSGIFLPEYHHVANYCLTGNFSSCRHFQGLAPAKGADTELAHNNNRRRSDRIHRYRSFRFSEIIGSDARLGRCQDDAWTVDLSAVGIRFTCRQLLDLKTTIRFQLEGDNVSPPLTGTGQVVWCRPLAGTGLFQTGLAFSG
jgi:hypothetical protein